MATPDPPIEPRPETARARRAILVFGCGILVIVAILLRFGLQSSWSRVANRSDSSRTPRDTYIGSQSCAVCHPGEFASHSRSGHARTLRPAARAPQAIRLNGATFADPERRGASWSYSLRDGLFWTERREGEVFEDPTGAPAWCSPGQSAA